MKLNKCIISTVALKCQSLVCMLCFHFVIVIGTSGPPYMITHITAHSCAAADLRISFVSPQNKLTSERQRNVSGHFLLFTCTGEGQLIHASLTFWLFCYCSFPLTAAHRFCCKAVAGQSLLGAGFKEQLKQCSCWIREPVSRAAPIN